MFIPDFRFRSLAQAQTYDVLVHRKFHAVRIDATASGKTLPVIASLLKLRSVCRSVRALFVVPYVNLYSEMVLRFKAAGLSCTQWSIDHPDPLETVVVVAMDNTVDRVFQSFADRLSDDGVLAQIICDEGHGAVEDYKWRTNYVPSLKYLFSLNSIVLILTASLSPQFQHLFITNLSIPFTLQNGLRFIRSSTQRSNIRQEIVDLSHEQGVPQGLKEFERTAATIIMDIMETLATCHQNPKSRGIVFTREPIECERVAGLLNCGFVHGKMLTEQRNSVYEKWTTGSRDEDRLLVVTKAGYYGTNNLDLLASFHINYPDGMTEWMQSTGRIGRNSATAAWSYTFINGRPEPPSHTDVEVPIGRKALRFMLSQPNACLSLISGQFMDGEAIAQPCPSLMSHNPALSCSRCSPETRTRQSRLLDRSKNLLFGSPSTTTTDIPSTTFSQYIRKKIRSPEFSQSAESLPGFNPLSNTRPTASSSPFLRDINVPPRSMSCISKSQLLPPIGHAAVEWSRALRAHIQLQKDCLDDVKRVLDEVRGTSDRHCWLCWYRGNPSYAHHHTISCHRFVSFHKSPAGGIAFDTWKASFHVDFIDPGTSAMHPTCGFDQSSEFFHNDALSCRHPNTVHPIMYILYMCTPIRVELWKSLEPGEVDPGSEGFMTWAQTNLGKQYGFNSNSWMILSFLEQGKKNRCPVLK